MSTKPKLGQTEFVALIAMLFATIALSIDAMLPALTQMGRELSPAAPENATLVVGIFVLGMGIGTFFAGPLSDAYGRKYIILIGFMIYALGALWAAAASDLEGILAGRFLQGLAVAGPRIAAMAMVRDLYSGKKMASIMSFAMTVFAVVPAIAPSMGQMVMNTYGWRAIFYIFAAFALIVSLWLASRQPETLMRENRTKLSARAISSAVRECFSNRVFRFSVTSQMMVYAALFSSISTVQPIYAQTYDKADQFPLLFAASAILSMPASIINGKLVLRYGMRKLIKASILGVVITTSMTLVLWLLGITSVWLFFFWATTMFISIGFVFGNLNSLAMEPLGHIAGMAASINSAIATIGAAILAIPISLSFEGTPVSLLMGVLMFEFIALLLMMRLGQRDAPIELEA
ncbi:multidrug effflux MFS transporter [Cognatishimia activa]|uniref:multidrug effflux MFS transporter n=1 Tax=Cognatishimia activa TaxID=1715691 RepID=UPI002230B6F0|nr:multidrug effflux MFS transporter [Cognatishimia activa]UZD91995.1 multidrug effflux MFS transporter [Cognatishimia activa]